MYDLAKRSLAFTVATGGLLLTGTAYSPALAAVGVGVPQGPAQAQGVQNDASTSASSVNTAGSSGDAAQSAPEGRAEQAPPDLLSSNALHPNIPAPAPRAGSAGPGAAATSNTKSSGGIVSGNNIQIPINIGIELCGNNVKAGSVSDTAGGGNCSMKSGSTASSTTSHSGGIGSGNDVQAPVNVPILACDNTVGAVVVKDTLGSADCSAGDSGSSSGPASGGASSTAKTDHSGGILSGNIVQAPVNVPINACGNDVNAVTLKSTEGGADCTNSAEGSAPTMPGAPAPGSGGASATAVSVDNGGIGSGTTVQLPINVPVNLCGNSADGATFESKLAGGVCENNGGSATAILGSTGNSGIVAGNSVQTPIQVPVNACGTEVVGVADKLDDQKPDCANTNGGGNTPPGSTTINVSSNNGGIGSGNSAQTPINVPVNACGVNGSVGGVHDSQSAPECSTNGTTTTVNVGTNNGGIGSGNNAPVQVNVPVNACGADVDAVQGETDDAVCTNTTPPSTTPPTTTPPTTTPPTTTPPTTTPPTTTPPTTTPPTTTPPTTTPPTTTPPTTTPPTLPPPTIPVGAPPPTTPGTPPTTPGTPPTTPGTPPPSGTSSEAPVGPSGPPPGGQHPGLGTSANGNNNSNLAHTGADIGIALGVAGAALLGGLGLRAAARRREGE